VRTPLIVLNATMFVLLVAASCLVDRRASDFTCSQDSDCAGLPGVRVCDTAIGYCTSRTARRSATADATWSARPARSTARARVQRRRRLPRGLRVYDQLSFGLGMLVDRLPRCGVVHHHLQRAERVRQHRLRHRRHGVPDHVHRIQCLRQHRMQRRCLLGELHRNGACGTVDCLDSCSCMATCTGPAVR